MLTTSITPAPQVKHCYAWKHTRHKQIAVAYGLGLRLDLDFFILRFDGGMKALNPVYDVIVYLAVVMEDYREAFGCILRIYVKHTKSF